MWRSRAEAERARAERYRAAYEARVKTKRPVRDDRAADVAALLLAEIEPDHPRVIAVRRAALEGDPVADAELERLMLPREHWSVTRQRRQELIDGCYGGVA